MVRLLGRLVTVVVVVCALGACAAGRSTPSPRGDMGAPAGDGSVPVPVPPSPLDGGGGDGDVMDACAGITCPTGRICRAGVCELDGSCTGVMCMTSELCVPGRGCIPLEVDEDGDGASVGDGDCDDRDAMVRPGATERCNAIDDDCNGMADEGNPGGGATCNTGMSGPCSAGVLRCLRGEVSCAPEAAGEAESCNGEDDDCDGMIDDGNPGGGGDCATGMQGACGVGEERCEGGRVSCVQTTMPRAESCDGTDDDCDGMTDEDDPGGGGGCSTGMPGICANGVAHCRGGAIACDSMRMPTGETCNREDDDCDGSTDEGIQVDLRETTFAALSVHHSDCSGFGSRVDSCAAAVHRFCAAESPCAPVGGIGPFDTGTGRPTVACIAGGAAMTVSFADLSAAQPPCDRNAVAHLDVCWTAAHRVCQMRGHTTGYGPIEHSDAGADIVCLDRGEIVEVPFSTLASYQPACNDSRAVSLACTTAIHRFCSDRMGGGGTGYGSVEHSDGNAYVVCLAP